jgi:hypothetical protein
VNATGLQRWGIDARLILFIPLSTGLAVCLTAVVLGLGAALHDPAAVLPAMVLFTVGGLWVAIHAWPMTIPLSLATWVAAFATLRSRMSERQTAPIAGALASLPAAAALAFKAGQEVAFGIVAILPGTVAGAVIAARAIYRKGGP